MKHFLSKGKKDDNFYMIDVVHRCKSACKVFFSLILNFRMKLMNKMYLARENGLS